MRLGVSTDLVEIEVPSPKNIYTLTYFLEKFKSWFNYTVN